MLPSAVLIITRSCDTTSYLIFPADTYGTIKKPPVPMAYAHKSAFILPHISCSVLSSNTDRALSVSTVILLSVIAFFDNFCANMASKLICLACSYCRRSSSCWLCSSCVFCGFTPNRRLTKLMMSPNTPHSLIRRRATLRPDS